MRSKWKEDPNGYLYDNCICVCVCVCMLGVFTIWQFSTTFRSVCHFFPFSSLGVCFFSLFFFFFCLFHCFLPPSLGCSELFLKSHTISSCPVRFDEFNLDVDVFLPFLNRIVQIQRDIFSFRFILFFFVLCMFFLHIAFMVELYEVKRRLDLMDNSKIAYFQITNQVHKV